MKIRVLAWIVLVSQIAFAPMTLAQDDAKKTARKLLAEGDRFLQRGNYLAKKGKREKANEQYLLALDNYQRAFEAVPKPQIYFAIGEAETKLGRYLDAFKHYTTLLEESEKVSDELRAAVEVRIDAVKAHLAVITVKAVPKGATVSLDGEEIGKVPLAQPLVMEPGEHLLVIRLKGHTPFEEKLTLSAGDKSTKSVKLELVPDIEEEPKIVKTSPRKKREAPSAPGKGILIAGLVTTSTFAAVATITGIVAVSKHGTLTDGALPIDDREAAGDSGKTLAIVTDVMLLGAVAAGAFTTYYYYKVYRPRQRAMELSAQTPKAVWVSPYVAEEAAGLVVGGSF
jgi:tetratricopeptide (TPR) repeat protein